MQAIILAAGLSSRLRPLTGDRPKCLLEVGRRTLLARQLDQLDAAGIRGIVIATGYQGTSIEVAARGRAAFRPVTDWAARGNLHSLMACGDALRDDVVLLHSDVLITTDTLRRLLASDAEAALLCDLERSIAGTMRIRRHGTAVHDLGLHIPVADGHGTFVGAARLSGSAARRLHSEIGRLDVNPSFATALWTDALPRLAAAGLPLLAVPTAGEPWLEVDTPEDLEAARGSVFGAGGRHARSDEAERV